jgi:prepilin-type N-terminal cleavage/methylation domain-containing protein
MQVRNKKGFTLLEVLLVIALIGILIGTILVSVNPNRQLGQARNLTRKSDITTIYNALEYHSVKNRGVILNTITTSYQEICDTGTRKSTDALPSATYCDGKINLSLLVPTYINSIPKDSLSKVTSSTGYEVAKTSNNQISVRAKNPELGEIIAINPIP